jgi:hypothetical protein
MDLVAKTVATFETNIYVTMNTHPAQSSGSDNFSDLRQSNCLVSTLLYFLSGDKVVRISKNQCHKPDCMLISSQAIPKIFIPLPGVFINSHYASLLMMSLLSGADRPLPM